MMNFDDVKEMVDRQAKDEGLWFIAETAPEVYLQDKLRELHNAIEMCETPNGINYKNKNKEKKMRAKFICDWVKDYSGFVEVELSAVHSDTKEDNEFSEATPVGNLKMTIDNENARGFLKPGKKYYLDFIQASE